MKKWQAILTTLAISLLLLCPKTVLADSSPDLVISQYKVTSSEGQFFLLYNRTDDEIDMSTVQLVYYNHYNLAAASSSKVITLSGVLPAHGYYLVNDGPLVLCYQMVVNSLSLGFSTTAGSVQVFRLSQSSAGAPVTSVINDSASWSKTKTTGVTQLPATSQFLLRQPVDTNNNPLVLSPGSGSWLVVATDSENPCLLTTTVTNAPEPIIPSNLLLLSSTPPPVTIINLTPAPSGPYMPAGNIGLMAPVINELLPNPGSPATDANDEFIELYNPNNKQFDLTGFKLGVGVDSKKQWKFPDRTILKAKSFTVFTSAQMSINLTNNGGMSRLIDPFGNTISTTGEYGSAKDNQAWALANNDWTWTSSPTPGKANIINIPAGKTTARVATASGGTSGTVRASNMTGAAVAGASTLGTQPADVTTLHPSALASVAVMAVGYGAYEYKQDIANRIRKFRSDRASRRAASGKS